MNRNDDDHYVVSEYPMTGPHYAQHLQFPGIVTDDQAVSKDDKWTEIKLCRGLRLSIRRSVRLA